MYDYGYGDYYDIGYNLGSAIGGLLIFFLVIGLIALGIWIVSVIATWKVFKKAGKGGWEAIIPFYDKWVLVEISGLNWWWFLIVIAPFIITFIPLLNLLSGLAALASLFAQFNCYFNLAKKFNKGTGFAVCLTIFPVICIPLLGFSKNNVYNGSVTVSNNGVFGNSGNVNGTNNYSYNNVNNNNNYQNNSYQQPNYNNVNNNFQQNVPASNNFNQNMPGDNNNNGFTNTTSEPVQEYSFCGNCGTKLNKDVKFCPNCGNPNI